ncbi:thiolase family protein [Blastococcus sp. TF02A-26]|uniref:thiolase family protein n=1 Tax=Blastococcus sp. TF02A-26 TaxID=2250577 RepID=UPI000DE818BA|nr:thiolase family protein [Blastococcus sp. TF02A-26]RBY84386.1 thiolase family protein [Blastococcus sp. TF02A-26]
MPGSSRRAAIVGVANTAQARRLEGATSRGLAVGAALAALDDAGLTLDDVDGISGDATAAALLYDLRLGPAWLGRQFGIQAVTEAVHAVEAGEADVVLVVAAEAGAYTDRSATAPWTRPENEFVVPFGLFTAAEFALVARRHMITYGTTPEQLARVAATIRTNGSTTPGAVYAGRGPVTVEDVLASRMVADPFHLLDCSMTSEGGCALVIAATDRAADTASTPVHVLGSGSDHAGPAYRHPPAWDLAGRRGGPVLGRIGERAVGRAFAQAGLDRADVDVLELYDPFSFEVIRQLEAFGFCGPGEGGPYVDDGHIGLTGRTPVTTDGGTMAFSHAGAAPQMFQRVVRGVQQLRGDAGPNQVPDARVALCSGGGAGALFTTVVLLGTEVP